MFMNVDGVRFLQQVREAVAEGNRHVSPPSLVPRGGVGYQGAGATLSPASARRLAPPAGSLTVGKGTS